MDTLNYILFKNPVSSTLIHGTNSALAYAGITKKASTSSTQIMKEVMKPFESLGCNRTYIRLAGISGAAAVVLAAMGAHRQYNPENAAELEGLCNKANKYHFYSTLALMGVPFVRKPHLTGPLLVTGTILFCGPLYYRALTNDTKKSSKLNRVVPIGGFIMIAAWLSMIL